MSGNEQQRSSVPSRFEIRVQKDVRVPTTEDGITLSVDTYLPVTDNPVPAVLMGLPYRKDLSGNEAGLRWLAARGYGCVLMDLRGIGSSDGVPRPKNHPDEGDDMAAGVEWAAAQSWCTGSVGVWGASAGGVTTMRVATRPPTALKAIIPSITPLDPAREAFYHDGTRVDMHQRVSWSGSMLVQQLLPPLLNHTSLAEQDRWHRRIYETEPHLVDLARSAGDPAWKDRIIDASLIRVPSLLVGGWRDLYAESMVRAYEEIRAPKKLLIGPWMHSTPENSPFEPIDFLSIALRWWDFWLSGIDNGVMDEPPVTLYMLGDSPGWHSYNAWPPSDETKTLSTDTDTTLRAEVPLGSRPKQSIAVYDPDPTTGALSGLWGIPNSDMGSPLDQHDDDMRAVSFTSERLSDSLAICGRPDVTISLLPSDITDYELVQRIVVRIADVDEEDRSTFIAAGVLVPESLSEHYTIVLRPIAYRVPAGHRLRVIVSDSDFPRLTPLPEPSPMYVTGVDVRVPTVPDIATQTSMPAKAVEYSRPRSGRWTITRDPVSDGIEVAITRSTTPTLTGEGHLLQISSDVHAAVRKSQPEASVTTGSHRGSVRMGTGESIVADVTTRCTQTSYWVRAEVTLDGVLLFQRSWDIPMTPERRSSALGPASDLERLAGAQSAQDQQRNEETK